MIFHRAGSGQPGGGQPGAGLPAEMTFFTEAERACASALLDHLTGQYREPRVPVLQMIEARLAAGQTDGPPYEDMPEDGQAWRDTLSYLDADARGRYGSTFADAAEDDRHHLIQAVQDRAFDGKWHGLSAMHVWSLWTRYACAAFYAHPAAWAEIGFPAPAWTRSSP